MRTIAQLHVRIQETGSQSIVTGVLKDMDGTNSSLIIIFLMMYTVPEGELTRLLNYSLSTQTCKPWLICTL